MSIDLNWPAIRDRFKNELTDQGMISGTGEASTAEFSRKFPRVPYYKAAYVGRATSVSSSVLLDIADCLKVNYNWLAFGTEPKLGGPNPGPVAESVTHSDDYDSQPKDLAFKCPQCDKAYETPGALRMHTRRAHEGMTGGGVKNFGKRPVTPLMSSIKHLEELRQDKVRYVRIIEETQAKLDGLDAEIETALETAQAQLRDTALGIKGGGPLGSEILAAQPTNP